MTRNLLSRLLVSSVVALTCVTLVGCDGGGASSTGPNGEVTRDKDPNAKTIKAPGTEGADTHSTSTTGR